MARNQSAHYYTADGHPCHEVPTASDPGKMRPVTIRDAKKLNLFPSVTTLMKDVAKPFLTEWQINQAIHAALANAERLDGETEDAHIKRIENAAYSIVDDAAKRGSLIHEAIEQFVTLGEMTQDSVIRPLLDPYFSWHQQNVQEVFYAEKTVIHHSLGYAGRLDLKARLLGRGVCIIDYKSRKRGSDGKYATYDENFEQLEAYRQADGTQNPMADRCVTIIINSSTPDLHVHEWPMDDAPRFWTAFRHLILRWQSLKKFAPVAP